MSHQDVACLPSRTGLVIRNERDAKILIQAVGQGILSEVTVNTGSRRKVPLSVGDVFIWRFGDIRSWDDGRQWCNYRTNGGLTYKDEVDGDLVRMEYSTSSVDPGTHWFLVAYCSNSDKEQPRCIYVTDDPLLKTVKFSLAHQSRPSEGSSSSTVPGIQLKTLTNKSTFPFTPTVVVPAKRAAPTAIEFRDQQPLPSNQVLPAAAIASPSPEQCETMATQDPGTPSNPSVQDGAVATKVYVEQPLVKDVVPLELDAEPPAKRPKLEESPSDIPSTLRWSLRRRYRKLNPARQRRFALGHTRIAGITAIIGNWLTRAFDFVFPSW
ncbi:hypothetical protein FRC03_000699 [Tulasnella sp. 419]|nr:hypothetical protein FRC03_000699 [Tulasnella sp. 419]